MSIQSQVSAWLSQITIQDLIAYGLIPALTFVGALLAFQVIRAILYYQLTAFKQRRLGELLALRVKQINILTAVVTSAYVAIHAIPNLNFNVHNVAYVIFLIIWTWQLLQLATCIINYFTDKALERESGPENETAYKFLSGLFKVMTFIVAVLLILSNLGYDVTSLIAGLGIGGIAIALAVQNVLADVITSFSIIADKPFKPGDFIVFDDYSGWIMRIGIKSTRIRSVNGEELIVANTKLVGSVVRNFTASNSRRCTQTVIVSYDTAEKLLQDIPAFISDILQAQEHIDKTNYTVNLVRFDPAGHVFELGFDVTHPDQQKFNDVQQSVLFAISEKLHSEKIQFV